MTGSTAGREAATPADLDLHPRVRQGIDDAGYTHFTPIQARTLPITLAGGNVIGQAQTGSGKTAAFLIAAFERLLGTPARAGRAEPDPRALIIAPTRELIKQISDNAALLGAHTGLKVHTVFGGLDYRMQRQQFSEGVDVLVGTPGRLIDYFKQQVYRLEFLDVLVVDECDRMFDMGFIDDVRWLIRRMPPGDQRQNLLFSATVDFRVEELAWEHMNHPQLVAVDPDQLPPQQIRQVVYHVGRSEKAPLLLGLLRRQILTSPDARVIIFTNTRGACLKLADLLNANDVPARALSGALSQEARFKALGALKGETPPIVVATDVASRGLHIDAVTHVINWDVPDNPKDYVHRIGRTARAGAAGEALILASEDTVENLPRVEEELGMKIDVAWPEPDMLLPVKHAPRRRDEGAGPHGRPHHGDRGPGGHGRGRPGGGGRGAGGRGHGGGRRGR